MKVWNLSSSIIILISVVVSCFLNTKVILPRFKYFLLIIISTIIIVVSDSLYSFNTNILTDLLRKILCLYFLSFVLYLKKDNAMGNNNKIRKTVLFIYLALFTICISCYYIFISVDVHTKSPYYDFIKKYLPFVFYIIQAIWIFIESIFNKNKKIPIILSLIVLVSALTSYYIFNENVLSLGVSLTLLFLYNGVEGNTNFYDLNLINYNANIFNLAYSNKKMNKNKVLVFIKICSNDVNKRTSLNKLFGKNFFKFKRKLFGCIINYDEFISFKTKQEINPIFKIDNEVINYKWQMLYIKNNFYNLISNDLTNLINYILSDNKIKKTIYEITEADLESIKKMKLILERVKDAVNNDGFEMYYQPIYSTKNKCFSSAEALIRLKNIEGIGYVSPEIFIPLAENNGLAEQIGNIVFDKVCSFYNKENLSNYGIKYIELNVSGLHIIKDNIVDDFTKIINKYNISPKNINIEITETAQIGSQEKMNENLKNLRNLGFKFSMDDFGSGYSNMTNIIENNYELIKIDKSIVWGALKENQASEESKILLNTCIVLAHKLNRKIVAEGVEDELMVEYLKARNVEYLQGYFYSKPRCENDFITFLKENASVQNI